jgi:hypothetical protein
MTDRSLILRLSDMIEARSAGTNWHQDGGWFKATDGRPDASKDPPAVAA